MSTQTQEYVVHPIIDAEGTITHPNALFLRTTTTELISNSFKMPVQENLVIKDLFYGQYSISLVKLSGSRPVYHFIQNTLKLRIDMKPISYTEKDGCRRVVYTIDPQAMATAPKLITWKTPAPLHFFLDPFSNVAAAFLNKNGTFARLSLPNNHKDGNFCPSPPMQTAFSRFQEDHQSPIKLCKEWLDALEQSNWNNDLYPGWKHEANKLLFQYHYYEDTGLFTQLPPQLTDDDINTYLPSSPSPYSAILDNL